MDVTKKIRNAQIPAVTQSTRLLESRGPYLSPQKPNLARISVAWDETDCTSAAAEVLQEKYLPMLKVLTNAATVCRGNSAAPPPLSTGLRERTAWPQLNSDTLRHCSCRLYSVHHRVRRGGNYREAARAFIDHVGKGPVRRNGDTLRIVKRAHCGYHCVGDRANH